MLDKLLKLIIFVLNIPIYWISYCIPKSNNIWIFGAWFGNRYSDNSRFLFEYVNTFQHHIIPVWLTKNKNVLKKVRSLGFRVYRTNSILGFWYSARASVAFCVTDRNDVNYININKSLKVQLWHGTPLKKIGYDDKISNNWSSYNKNKKFEKIKRLLFPFTGMVKWDYVCSSSPVTSLRFQSALGVSESQVLLTGFPRADVILNSNPPDLSFINDLREKTQNKKLILYAPTHRAEGRENVDYFTDLNQTLLEKTLKKNESLLLINLHYYQSSVHEIFKIENCSSLVYFLTSQEIDDISILLNHVDVMITDYSSIYFDYLLLNRPILFFPYDLKQYLTTDREFYEDYHSATPGPKCYNWDELIIELDKVLKGKDEYIKDRYKAQTKYNSYIDNRNCERITESIENIIKRNVQ